MDRPHDAVRSASYERATGSGFDTGIRYHIHSWKLIMESFQRSFSPFHCFKKGTCQYGLTAKPGQEYCFLFEGVKVIGLCK